MSVLFPECGSSPPLKLGVAICLALANETGVETTRAISGGSSKSLGVTCQSPPCAASVIMRARVEVILHRPARRSPPADRR